LSSHYRQHLLFSSSSPDLMRVFWVPGQTSPLRPRLVVSRNACPPQPPSPHANSFVIGTTVLNTNTVRFSAVLWVTSGTTRFVLLASVLFVDFKKDITPEWRATASRLRRETVLSPSPQWLEASVPQSAGICSVVASEHAHLCAGIEADEN
jgi:hypothetical protein